MLSSILFIGKYFIIAGITAIFIASLALIVWSLVNMGKKMMFIFKDIFKPYSSEQKRLDIEVITVIDGILIAILLYLFSSGLFELFIGRVVTPEWLVVKNIYDLKDLLISMIVVILAIVFLEHLIEWKDAKTTFYFGIAIAIVIGALTLYVKFVHSIHS
ncbi:MAG TPA: YqhA family protein [Candidatus Brocadiia bacterium]|nr:YqhA family protein [Planctomycetota bacterium]